MRGGCALKYFFQALQHVPSQNCPMSFPFTMLTLGSWRACGVWWADSPQATEVLNHHVFAPLKFHSAWAEIWSVKKLLFPSFQLHSWGKFWKAAKANWTQKSHGKNPVAEQCSGGSGNRLCRECLGLPGQARCWPAGGRGAAAPLALPSPPAPTVHFFSLCHPKSNHGITAVGEKESTAMAQRQGKAAESRKNLSSPPRVWVSGAQVCSPSAQHPLTSTGKGHRDIRGKVISWTNILIGRWQRLQGVGVWQALSIPPAEDANSHSLF